MLDCIQELLNRNLQEVFGEGDAARRRALVEEFYTDDCVVWHCHVNKPEPPFLPPVPRIRGRAASTPSVSRSRAASHRLS